MPAPTLPPGASKGLAPGALNFLKQNAKFGYGGAIGGMFLAGDIKGIFDADNKFKALLKTFKDFVLIRVAMVGVFTAVGAAVKGLVRDTGALDAALKKLNTLQVFSRNLSGLVGSLTTARKRMAELYEVSTKSPFKFEDLAQANIALETFTRGAYSSVEATKEVGSAAVATGNNVADTARAVGLFYDNLAEGKPIDEATEQLRQMGLISQSTARHLVSMAEGGQGTAAVFRELKESLASLAPGAEAFKNELANVTAEHERAVEEMKAGFGAPFTESEVKNTQNMTAAMKAFTPTVSAVANSLNALYSGFSTATTSLVKWGAQNKVVNGIIKATVVGIEALTVVALTFGTVAAVQLTRVILGLGGALTQMSVAAATATVALRAAAIVTVWGAVAVGIATVVGAVINYHAKIQEAEKAHQDWVKSQREGIANMAAEAAAIKTVADKHAFLAKSIAETIAKEKELHDIRHQARKDQEFLEKLKAAGAPTETGDPYADKAAQRAQKAEQDKAKEIQRTLNAYKEQREEVMKMNPVHEKLIQAEVQRRTIIEEQNKGVVQRANEARKGLEVQAAVEDKQSKIDAKIEESQQRLAKDRDIYSHKTGQTDQQKEEAQKGFQAREADITKMMKERSEVALGVPETSAAFKGAKVEQLQYAKKAIELQKQLGEMQGDQFTEEDRRAKQILLDRAKALSGGVKYTAAALEEAQVQYGLAAQREERQVSPEELRQERVQTYRIDTEIGGKAARARGDVRGAEAAEDVQAVMSRFDELLPLFGKDKAAKVSLAETQQDIAGQYIGASRVVSSMAAVGGGGGVSGVDPQMASARRREELQSRMVELLTIMTGQETQQPTPPTFQP